MVTLSQIKQIIESDEVRKYKEGLWVETESIKGQPSQLIRYSIEQNNAAFHNEALAIANQVISLSGKIKSDAKDKYKEMVLTALYNVSCNHLISPKLKMSISRAKGAYGQGKSPYSYRVTVNSLDRLIDLGFIEEDTKGFYDHKRKEGKNTRYIATSLLVGVMVKSNLKMKHFSVPVSHEIVVRDEKKEKLEGVHIPEEMYQSLKKINSILCNSEILLDLPDRLANKFFFGDHTYVDLLINKQYARIFSGNLDSGGRFYRPWWQRISKELRSYIVINGNATVELDYKNMHPYICSKRRGADYDESKDVYMLEGVSISDELGLPSYLHNREFRRAVKVTINALLNSPYGRIKTQSEFKDVVLSTVTNGVGVYKDYLGVTSYKEYIEQVDCLWIEFVELIRREFSHISDLFNDSEGLRLQKEDSDIAEEVMLHFSDKGIPCLCIHDSFIVEEQYAEELKQVMEDKHTKVIGFPPLGITKES